MSRSVELPREFISPYTGAIIRRPLEGTPPISKELPSKPLSASELILVLDEAMIREGDQIDIYQVSASVLIGNQEGDRIFYKTMPARSLIPKARVFEPILPTPRTMAPQPKETMGDISKIVNPQAA